MGRVKVAWAVLVGTIFGVVMIAPAVVGYLTFSYEWDADTHYWLYPDTTYQCDFDVYDEDSGVSAAMALTPKFGYEYDQAQPELLYDGLPQSEWPVGVTLEDAYASHPELIEQTPYANDSLCYGPFTSTTGPFGTTARYRASLVVPELATGYYELSVAGRFCFYERVGGSNWTAIYNSPDDSFQIRYGLMMRVGGVAVYHWSDAVNPEDEGSSVSGHSVAMNTAGYNVSDFHENWVYDRPFTAAEVESMQMVIELKVESDWWSAGSVTNYDGGTVWMHFADAGVLAVPASYTPPVISAHSFILRPDEDLYNFNWHPIPEDDLFDNLNESTEFSDKTTTYIRSAWAQGHLYRCGFENPPSTALTTSYYSVSFWMIAKENATNSIDDLWVAAGTIVYTEDAFAPFEVQQDIIGEFDLTTTWANESVANIEIGRTTNVNWTIDQIKNVTVSIMPSGNDPDGGICVSQIALICTPTSAIPEAEVPTSFSDMGGWLNADGLQTIFGIMGFLMLLISPVSIFVMSKTEGGIAAFFYAALLAVMGIGFLWAGLSGHW